MLKEAIKSTTRLNYQRFRNQFLLKKGLMKFFDLHEFESKSLFHKFNLRVERFAVVKTLEDAVTESQKMTGKVVLKCQVHAGGRGKGKLTSGLQGGVQLCSNLTEVKSIANQMLGYNLITIQTPPEGLPVKSLLISEVIDIKKQFYLAFLLDRKYGGPVVLSSSQGGMNIEEVAHKDQNAISVTPINYQIGITNENIDHILSTLPLSETEKTEAADQLRKIYSIFTKFDCTQIEINPWAVDTQGKVYLLDAKVKIDESAEYRQKELFEMKHKRDSIELKDESEEKAKEVGINYVALQGNIGCMVNGAGLAMATMDIIKLKGGDPANFLDVGGGADENQVTQAFEILNSHPNVKAILVNIFGGIMKCDIIAKGIINAAKKTNVKIPVIIRLTGTNAEEGKKILKDFSEKNQGVFNFLTATNIDEAAELAVSITNTKK